MALKLVKGTVVGTQDMSRTGQFKVKFKGVEGPRDVKLISPYGNKDAGFIAIPAAQSQVICIQDTSFEANEEVIYYMGSVMGMVSGKNTQAPDTPPENPDLKIEKSPGDPGLDKVTPEPYVDKNKQGIAGPTTKEYTTPFTKPENINPWPSRFQDMYDAKGITPEAIGLTSQRADAFKIASRYNSAHSGRAKDPIQDYKIGMMSGNGKRIEAVDSPIVDGIVMSNEHRGKDYMIWSSGSSKESSFSEGELYWRTHGPINLWSISNRFHIWIEDGLNIEIENKGGSKYSGGPNPNLGNPGGFGNTEKGFIETRQGVYGNETAGCIDLLSHHNNISLRALADDSVIHIEAPGNHSRIIIDTSGSVDINADKKITIQSNTEVEINAPIVDINGTVDPTRPPWDERPDLKGEVHIDSDSKVFLQSRGGIIPW